MIYTTAGLAFQTGGTNTQQSLRKGGNATANSNKGKFMKEMSQRNTRVKQGPMFWGDGLEGFTIILTGRCSSTGTVPCTADRLACLPPPYTHGRPIILPNQCNNQKTKPTYISKCPWKRDVSHTHWVAQNKKDKKVSTAGRKHKRHKEGNIIHKI